MSPPGKLAARQEQGGQMKGVTASIGDVSLGNRTVLAPMAGVTDRAFRQLVQEAGCGLLCAEMISDKALVHNNARTGAMLELDPAQHPISVQLVGSEPETMARAARIIQARGADIIDINMGCPAPKVVRNGEGAALMRNPVRAARIVDAVVRAVSRPVTVKIRKGWNEDEVNAVQVAGLAVAAGAAAVAVHARTRNQFYSGHADWAIIRAVRDAVDVPVIGNGDVWTPEDARRMLDETGCDAVMIGRGALGNPWLFSRIVHYLATGSLLPEPGPAERVAMAIRHLGLLVRFKGEYTGVREMRKHGSWYLRGLPGAARARVRLNAAQSEREMEGILLEVLEEKQ